MKSLDKEVNPHAKIQLDKAIEIVYLDNHLLVALKPAGLLTQPNDLSNSDSLEEELKAYVKKRFQKPGLVFLHAVQRLDKSVSGLVLFARTSKALSRLNVQMREKAVEKKYLALVEGQLSQEEGRLENFLFHANHRAEVVSKNHPQAKKALLHFQVVKKMDDQSLLEIKLLTGRYHQIRAQLAYLGHPIVGDAKYGSKIDYAAIKLHASHLEFVHPVTKANLSFFERASF